MTARALAGASSRFGRGAIPGGRTYVLAAGKAADRMAAAAAEHFHDGEGGSRLAGGLVVAYPGDLARSAPHPGERATAAVAPGSPGPAHLSRVAGGHPVPTAASEQAGRRALALAASLGANDRLLVLLSGGASALMAVPAAGLSLEDKRSTTATLLEAGAEIHALNTVRKHLSAIKGGRLAAATRALCDVLAISDVVGDDLSVIASGPAVADATSFTDAADILGRLGGEARFPSTVVRHLADGAAGRIPDTPKPGDPRLARAHAAVIGTRRDAMEGALAEAASRGYRAVILDAPVVGEARLAAAFHLRSVLALAGSMDRPLCVVSSGETTVRVTGQGKGGRNQEFTLAAAELLWQVPPVVSVASAGTDGIDGPTDAAGAYADSSTVERADAGGLSPGSYLADNNSYAFFDALGDLIHTGSTGTNVGDLQVILLA